MELLPNHNNAVIDLNKLENYCLDINHPIGKHKAKVLQSALSLNHNDAKIFADLIIRNLYLNEAVKGKGDEYGQRYFVDMKISNFGKEAIIRTAWIVEHGEDIPRLITCCLIT